MYLAGRQSMRRWRRVTFAIGFRPLRAKTVALTSGTRQPTVFDNIWPPRCKMHHLINVVRQRLSPSVLFLAELEYVQIWPGVGSHHPDLRVWIPKTDRVAIHECGVH